MDGYNAVIRISKERPQYLPLVKKCIEAQNREKEKPYFLGFEWDDAGIWPPKLALLATEYELLDVTYKSNSSTCYTIRDIDGVKKALEDIEANKVGKLDEQVMALRIWLTPNTMKRLRHYLTKEFPDKWDAENLIVERALLFFLEKYDVPLAKENA